MIWTFLIILWVLFLTMFLVGVLSVRQGTQVLGVRFLPEYRYAPEIKAVVHRFAIGMAAVLVVLAAVSCVLLLPAVRAYGEILMFLLVVADLAGSWLCFSASQKALLRLRKEKGWTPPVRTDVTVDLSVSREKGKSAVSPVFVWVFFVLSFVPVGVLLWEPEFQEYMPFGFSFIGPLCQLLFTGVYYQMKRLPVRLTSDDTAVAQMLARRTERVQSVSATVIALAGLLFWLGFFFSNCVLRSVAGGIASVVVLLAVLLGCAFWQQKTLHKLEDSVAEVTVEAVPERDSKWKWGCYYDPADPRILVPKRVASMGWTINLGRPAGKAIFAGIWVFIAAILLFAFGSGLKGYEVNVTPDAVVFDAAMYDKTVTREEVQNVELISGDLPSGVRTNGYGGLEKSFGHFRLDGYGDCMLYVYNDVPCAVVLTVSDADGISYVFVNEETTEKTETLYKTLLAWQAGE